MSTALAIAGVTQLLRDVLNDGLVDNDVGASLGTNVTVHARPPDRVIDLVEDGSVLNVCLYNVENQPGWANQVLPTRDARGARLANTPLTLDLFYLISAVATEDLHQDILLGYAMQILHEHPGFDRAEIAAGLSPAPAVAGALPPALQALAATGLADQVERLVIAPVYLSAEEMSRIWTSFQTNYRSSMAYRVSSVIIQQDRPSRSALPVLTIGSGNSGPQVEPTLEIGPPLIRAVTLPDGQPSARPGDVIVLRGERLGGVDVTAHFESPALAAEVDVVPEPGGTDRAQTVTIPAAPGVMAAGPCQVRISARRGGGDPLYRSNAAALQIAPVPALPPLTVSRIAGPPPRVEVSLTTAPELRPGQMVELFLGGSGAVAPARTAATDTAQFTFPDLPAGAYPVRLRVDGVESWLITREVAPTGPDFAPEPPVYDPAQIVTVPA
ncbi:DUF4255 domain-containing protein [Poseidonocella sedimentorum]|uniref:Pvc16 N-terminal domain-containing protein n=1 Tax=Poseidonocella sedimentorum TaxID=871652 RepID=A0A1I6DP59_9RHOB|nr:DUF4255 domain-containing protein [Poseidonocella sedimentorum]SFR07219.1 Protein of unknown function [Poseidonocella sedimentorum]